LGARAGWADDDGLTKLEKGRMRWVVLEE